MRLFSIMLMAVCLLFAGTAFAAEANPKAEIYGKVAGNIEKAKAESDYDKKLDFYSLALMGVGMNSYNGKISCSDPELPGIDAAMMELQKELGVMYDERVKAGNKPKIKPAAYATCEQVVAKKAADAKAKEEPKAKAANAPKAPPKQYVSMRSGTNYEVGRIYVDGDVCDKSNIKIGSIKPNGVVNDRSGVKIGTIKSDGSMLDKSGLKIGYIKPTGAVHDGSGLKIGSVGADGTVYGKSNQKIGIAPGLKKEWSAAFYFFFFK